jgi:hypothetical protein
MFAGVSLTELDHGPLAPLEENLELRSNIKLLKLFNIVSIYYLINEG